MLWLAVPLWVIFLLSSLLLSLLVSFCFLEIRDNSFGVLSMTLLKPKGHYNKDGRVGSLKRKAWTVLGGEFSLISRLS